MPPDAGDADFKHSTDGIGRDVAEERDLERVRFRMEKLGISKETEEKLYAMSEVLETMITEASRIVKIFEQGEEADRRCATGMSEHEFLSGKTEQSKVTCLGDFKYRMFLTHVANAKMLKYGPQMEVVRAASASLIRQFFGDEFEANRPRIEIEYGITDFRPLVNVTMARRNGKTEIASVIEAAAMAVQGGYTAIFAPYEKQSVELMKLIRNRLLEIEGGDESKIVVDNKNRVEYSKKGSKSDPDRGIIRCFSGKTDAARGFKALRIIFDEASFATKDFILNNVFPGMMLRDVFVMMISSPPKDANHVFAKMCNAKYPDGESVYKYVRIDNMCDSCRKKDNVVECPHVSRARPGWLAGEEAMRSINHVYGIIDPAGHRREIQGIMEDTDVTVFSPDKLEALAQAKHVKFDTPPQTIIVGVDTSNGADSETAVCAMCQDASGNSVVSVYVFIAAAVVAASAFCRAKYRLPAPSRS